MASAASSTRSDTPVPELPVELRGPLQRQTQVDPEAATAMAQAESARVAAQTKAGIEALVSDAATLVMDTAAAVATHDAGTVLVAVEDALKVVRDVEVVSECNCLVCMGWAAWRRGANVVQKPAPREVAAMVAGMPVPSFREAKGKASAVSEAAAAAATAAAAAGVSPSAQPGNVAPPALTLTSPGSAFSFLK